MAEIKVTELPVIVLDDFTDNDRFLIIDDGAAKQLTRSVFKTWLLDNVQGEKGEQGVAGRDGTNGTIGRNGADGQAGLSAYQIAVSQGFVGSQSEWLESLKGSAAAKGEDGGDGWTPVLKTTPRGLDVVLQLTDWVGGTGTKPTTLGYMSDSGIVANIANAKNIRGDQGLRGLIGETGSQGNKGEQGIQGLAGDKGDSAYEIAVEKGYEGEIEDWIASLKGEKGTSGWNPLIRTLENEGGIVLELFDWVGGIGTKPTLIGFIGSTGIVQDISLATNIRGNKGDVGEQGDAETPESIKTKYESNEDTNALTDELLLKITELENISQETEETIKTKYELNENTNAFTDDLKSKIDGDIVASKIVNLKDSTNLDIWVGTQIEYDEILEKSPTTLYMVTI